LPSLTIINVITPYRRHTAECLNGPESKPELGLTTKLKARGLSGEKLHNTLRSYEHCKCPVWYEGSWNNKRYPRKSTKLNNWKAGERFCADLMTDPRSDDESKPIHDAIEEWHVACDLKLSLGTMGAHRLLASSFEKFMADRRITLVEGVKTTDINRLRTEWKAKEKIQETTHHTRFVTLAAFFNFCVKQHWIDESPMPTEDKPALRPPTKKDTQPLDCDGTENNYRRVLAALGRMKSNDPRLHPLRRNPARLVALAQLFYESGMRLSDGIMFDMEQVVEGPKSCSYTYLPWKTRKYGKTTTTFFTLPTWRAIQALDPLSANRPFFDEEPDPFNVTPEFRKRLLAWETMADTRFRVAGEQAFVPDCRGHRFRNSFAVNALLRGAGLQNVQKWLGHTSYKTTERCYMPWVEALQRQSQEIYESLLQPGASAAASKVTELPRRRA
jgi:integrase